MLDKAFRPEAAEAEIYAAWETSGAFAAGRTQAGRGQKDAQPDVKPGRPFSIVIPPPNVTGTLHMGHAFNNTLQDVLARFERMRGRDVLWQPGTDHAGIATQMVVERQLAEEGITRHALGREAFIERVWTWKAESGGAITRQLRRLGCSCDWSRERFTMDDGLSEAVRKVFVDLYGQGLIYRDKRLVNWDPKLGTAISDLEVEQRPTQGFLWYIKYPVNDIDNTFITVATTRPETMLGDAAVAVHPDDERYRQLIGRTVALPLTGRSIPIVGDLHSDPEKGSGAVKITPGHDFNDFEVGRRHGLPVFSIFDATAKLNDLAPEPYRGLDRSAARERVLADLEAMGLLEKTEPHALTIPHGDRSGVVIEPYLTDQWYVDAAKLAKPAIAAVERGEIAFVPKNWEKTYFEWMRNIEPWCISRQIWWGHQIPAWYGPDGKVFVAMDEADAFAQAYQHYGRTIRDYELKRDEDVLDTWFSSQLWPFSTLGWPQKTAELDRYYPTDVLVTGFDIIFFWVARMIMAGLHFMGEVPFRTVYIHALVRDERGQKMSKSKGNIIDPIGLIDRFGADALRFTLCAMAAQGRDIKLAPARVEGYRNFATKLWNAARFGEMNACVEHPGFDPNACQQVVNRWILGEMASAAEKITLALDGFRFNEAADAVYRFIWNIYCDWYLEFIKPVLTGDDARAANECRHTSAYVLHQMLHLLHPFMPFVTEELWRKHVGQGQGLLTQRAWPNFAGLTIDASAAQEMNWVIRLIEEIRSVRSEMNVPAAARIDLILQGATAAHQSQLSAHTEAIARLARLGQIGVDGAIPQGKPGGSVQIVIDEATAILPLADVIDLAKEKERLGREMAKHQGIGEQLAAKLGRADFVDKAPEHVIEEHRERLAQADAAATRLSMALKRLN